MRIGRFEIINVEKRIREIYGKDGRESAYQAYRVICNVDVKESWRIVKPWLKK